MAFAPGKHAIYRSKKYIACFEVYCNIVDAKFAVTTIRRHGSGEREWKVAALVHDIDATNDVIRVQEDEQNLGVGCLVSVTLITISPWKFD